MSSITFDYNTHIVGSIARIFTGAFGLAIHSVKAHIQRKSAERRLGALDDRLLADIGVSRADIHNTVWGKTAR